MYRYADGQGLCDKRYDQFIAIKTGDDDEHGVPFFAYDSPKMILPSPNGQKIPAAKQYGWSKISIFFFLFFTRQPHSRQTAAPSRRKEEEAY